MEPADLTILILTKDEARSIARVLCSVPSGTPCVVVDAESRDDTAAIARGLGADVVVRPWRGFLEARVFALSLVRTPWACFLDADESFDDALREALLSAQPAEDLAAYSVLRLNRFCGRVIHGAGWFPEYLIRVFRPERVRIEARPATASGAALHERVIALGPTAQLGGALLHDSYPSIASYWQKWARYTSIEAASLSTSIGRALFASLRAALRFFWLLLARRALLDGWRGVIVAFGSALYPAAVHWKALRR